MPRPQRPGLLGKEENYIFLGTGRVIPGSDLEVYGFWQNHKIVRVRITAIDGASIQGVARTEVEDCCESDDRYYEIAFHGVLTGGYVRSIQIDDKHEHNPEK